MTTVAVTMVKNEADIIAATVGHMLTQVDHVIVADNGSTDGTRDILADLPCEVIDDPDPAYRQSEKMTGLAHRVRLEHGAEWVVPFDADEIWYSPFGRIADVLAGLDDYAVAPADLYDHVPTATDPNDPDPVRRIGWRRREPGPLPKVACRAHPQLTVEMGNHAAHYGVFEPKAVTGQLIVRHFPYRTAEQMLAKAVQGAAALRLTDLPDSAGAHWRAYADLAAASGPEAIEDVFRTWFWSPDPQSDPDLIFDPAP